MEGKLFLAYLLQEMIQNSLSGYIYYLDKSRKSGKIFVTQGILCSVLYQDSPINASELAAIDISKSVLLQNVPGPMAPSPETPDAASVLHALRKRARDESTSSPATHITA